MSKRYIVEKDFEYKGLRCVVIFSMNGWRNGYVGVPKSNKYYGKDYCDVEQELNYGDCHGGITYSSSEENSDYPVESDLWWFGFDCAHLGDGKDLDLAYEKFPEYREQILATKQVEDMFPIYELVRDLGYVEQNCISLANQLLK